MNREILFRGKAMYFDGKWREGNYWFDEKDNEHLIVHRKYLPILVHPETVGQYFGLEEVEGIKIFHGDILAYTYATDIRIVAIFPDNYKQIKDDCTLLRKIGTIYENPELIPEHLVLQLQHKNIHYKKT